VHGPVIAASARKHDIADEDILHAWRNQVSTAYYDDGFTMALGPSRSADLLEIGALEADDGVVIIHAMEARRGTLKRVLGE
jgi:transposase-like protein